MQFQTKDFDRISPTALLVAYARQFSNIPYAKALANLIGAQATVEQLLPQSSERPMELAVLIEGRYRAINQRMSTFNPVQVVELASGLSPRSLEITQNPEITFIESDLPALISQKQQLVSQLVGDRPNLHFAAIDATSQPNALLLHANLLDLQKPVMLLCEGLLMYLTFAQKQQVFTNIRELLQIYGGVWITPDLTARTDWSRRWQNDPILQRFSQKLARLTATSTQDTVFDHFDHIQDFVDQQGFSVEKYSTNYLLDQLTCLQPLGISLETAASLLDGLSIYVLTLKTPSDSPNRTRGAN